MNIAFQSMPCIHAEWVILGDDVRVASRILIFYLNTATGPKYSKDRVVLRPNVEINFNDVFLWHIFSGACGMLKSLRNHRQSQQPTRRNGRIAGGAGLVADADKMICTSKQVGPDVNTIIGDVMGWRNSKSIELSSSDDPTQVADWATGASRV